MAVLRDRVKQGVLLVAAGDAGLARVGQNHRDVGTNIIRTNGILTDTYELGGGVMLPGEPAMTIST